MEMDKTKMYLVLGGLAALGLVGVFLIIIFRPDASATAIAFVIQILGLASTGGVTIYMLGKAKADIEQVKDQNAVIAKSVNGNTDKLLSLVGDQLTPEERAAYDEHLATLSAVAG